MFGQEVGQICGRDGCKGIIQDDYEPDGGCSCHINGPCGYCTTEREYCPECEWAARDHAYVFNDCLVKDGKGQSWEWWKPRPLDHTKIDWRHASHTHFSMIKEGVYPLSEYPESLEAMKAIRPLVNGTFGGRFEYCDKGKFKFIAYTD